MRIGPQAILRIKVLFESLKYSSYSIVALIASVFVKRDRSIANPEFIRHQLQSGKINKILIIQLQQLGDNLAFTPTVKSIVEQLGHLHIGVLVNSVGYEVYKNFPNINQFYVDKTWYWGKGKRQLLPLLKIISQIRREKYDLAILDATEVALKYPVISYLTGSKYRLGFDNDTRGFFNTHVPDFDDHTDIKQLNLRIVKYLGLETSSNRMWLPTVEKDQQHANELLKQVKKEGDEKVIVIHQGSNAQSRQWFEESWIDLSNRLLLDPSVRIAFTGAGREIDQVVRLLGRINQPDRVFSIAGKTTIHSLKEFIELSDCFITLDSGPMHIGNTTNTKMIVLLSAVAKEERWVRSDNRVKVIRKDVSCRYCEGMICPLGTKECMKLITVDEIYKSVLETLSTKRSLSAC